MNSSTYSIIDSVSRDLALALSAPQIISENISNGAPESSTDTSRILDTISVSHPNNNQNSSNASDFTNSFFHNQTLSSLASDASESLFNDSWIMSQRRSGTSQIQVDHFNDTTIDASLNANAVAEAEMQEDAAPTDPMHASEIQDAIFTDQSEEDRNLSGGITDNDRIGTEDANAAGVDESIDVRDVEFVESLFMTPEEIESGRLEGLDQLFDQVDFGPDLTSGERAADFIQDPQNTNITGDTPVDTAVQHSLRSIEDRFNEMKGLIPGQHTRNITKGTHIVGTGVPSNNSTGKQVVQISTKSYEDTRSHYAIQMSKAEKTYQKLKNIESELSSIDNIVYALNLILSPEEKKNKAMTRVHRIDGVMNLLSMELESVEDEDGTFVPAILFLYSICKSMRTLLLQWISDTDSVKYLRRMEAFITPALHAVSISIEKLRSSILQSIKRAERFYLDTIESYQDSDASERDLSKVLKLDIDVSPSHSQFTKKMKQMFNYEIQSSMAKQRKLRKTLKAKTLLSSYNAGKATDMSHNLSITKQKIHTMNINTDNIVQKYNTVPAGAKINSRRLNLLETPLAMKERKSVPYVNEYEQSKLLFS